MITTPDQLQLFRLCIAEDSDSYKITHWMIYPEGLTFISSYLEARAASDFADEIVFFGLQYWIKRYLRGGIITKRMLPRLRALYKHHFMGVDGYFNEAGWRYIIEKHNGRMPVRIKAVAEGTAVPVSNVLTTIEPTDPKCAWLVNFLETALTHVWAPTTVGSLSRACKKTILKYMQLTVDDCLVPILLPSRLHDFGFRGVSSTETAAICGAAHLMNFGGTDNLAAIALINQYYSQDAMSDAEAYDETNGEWDSEESYKKWDKFYANHMPGFSIAATEHSQMTLLGPTGEREICRQYLKKFPNGYIACVSDSFDLFKLITEGWGGELKNLVEGRNGVLVIRPDSGDPNVVVLAVLEAIASKFGSRINSKGYKVLNDKVRVIQGDGVNYHSINSILKIMTDAGWSVENLAFGSGGALLQKVNRDTFAFAFKASYAEIDGVAHDVYKQPKTDSKKNSKRGRLALVKDADGKFLTVVEDKASDYPSGNLLRTVFENGKLLIDMDFAEIRNNAELEELKVHATACV